MNPHETHGVASSDLKLSSKAGIGIAISGRGKMLSSKDPVLGPLNLPKIDGRKPIMFRSKSSGLWYYNNHAAGEVSEIRLNGKVYVEDASGELKKDRERLDKLIALTNLDGVDGFRVVLNWDNEQDVAEVLDSSGALVGRCFEEVPTEHEIGTELGNEEMAREMFRRAIDAIKLEDSSGPARQEPRPTGGGTC